MSIIASPPARSPPTTPSPNSSPTTPQPCDVSSLSLIDSQSPPLHSKSDQIQIKRQREQLELDIKSLEQRHKALKAELSQLTSTQVSKEELFLIKSSTRADIDQRGLEKVSELNDNYSECLHSIRSLRTETEMLEDMIARETDGRKLITSDSSKLFYALDFHDIGIRQPQISNIQAQSFRPAEFEQKIEKTQNELRSLCLVVPTLRLQSEAAAEYSRSIQMQIESRGVGPRKIRAMVQLLQAKVAEKEAEVRKAESSLSEERKCLREMQTEFDRATSSAKATSESAEESFEKQIESYQSQINGIRSRIEAAVAEFKHSVRGSPKTRNESDIQSKDGDPNVDCSDLTRQRDALSVDVEKLKLQYNSMKSTAIGKEETMKSGIQALYEDYISCKNAILTSPKKIREMCPSPITKELRSLLSRIDQSLEEFQCECNEAR